LEWEVAAFQGGAVRATAVSSPQHSLPRPDGIEARSDSAAETAPQPGGHRLRWWAALRSARPPRPLRHQKGVWKNPWSWCPTRAKDHC